MEEDTYQDENYEEEQPMLDVIRHMLESDGDSGAAVDTAVKDFMAIQRQRLQKRRLKEGFDPETVAYIIDYVANPLFSVGSHTLLTSPQHDRCALFLTALMDADYSIFEAPDRKSYIGAFRMGLAITTESLWNTSCLPDRKPSSPGSQSWFNTACTEAIAIEALFAKLYQSKASNYGQKYSFAGLRAAFGLPDGDMTKAIPSDTEPQAAAYAREVAAQYILLSGEAVAEAVYPEDDGPDQRLVTKWKYYQEQFKRLAEENPSDEWNLGYVEHARQAYEKMVALSAAREA